MNPGILASGYAPPPMPYAPTRLAGVLPRQINPDALVLVYDTRLEPANNTISVPLNGTVNCTIDWGDGTSSRHTTTGFVTKTYAAPGVYAVQISGTMTQLNYGTGSSTTNNKRKLVRCLSFGNVGLTSLLNAFRNCVNLIECPAVLPGTVTDMQSVFSGANAFNQPIGNWNTSSVTSMTSMFLQASAFNQPIGNWNTSSVTNMSAMFFGATAFNQDISGWDIRRVITMGSMFNGSAWSNANYSAALIAWNALPDTNIDTPVAITGVSSVAGGVRFAAAGHQFNTGATVTISGTTSYDGTYRVNAATFMSTFDVTATFVSSQTGTAQQRRRGSVDLHAGTARFSAAAAAARNTLVTTYNWTITDGGAA